MSYTKTTWVNDSAPAINATNLNKIEQGIYDATDQAETNATNIGTLSNLTTTDKTDLVSAINEVDASVGSLQTELDTTYLDDALASKAMDIGAYNTDLVPYISRSTGGGISVGVREFDKVVGGTVAWNQILNPITSSGSASGITYTVNGDGSITFANTAIATFQINLDKTAIPFKADHIYLLQGVTGGSANTYAMRTSGSSGGYGVSYYDTALFKPSTSKTEHFRIGIASGATVNFKSYPMVIDLTALLGSTIADYIYTLETNNAGDGVAWFRNLFPNSYYDYNAGELMSVNASEHVMVGFNQFDKTTATAGKWLSNITGLEETSVNYSITDYIRVCANAPIYIPWTSTSRRWFYDLDKNPVTYLNNSGPQVFTPPTDGYIRVSVLTAGTGAIDLDSFCINISDADKNGTYEPYNKHTYALDSSLTLRGIPKLDADNKLYYDGDTYESDSTVTRKYGVVDLGTLNWSYDSGVPCFGVNFTSVKPTANNNIIANIINAKYTAITMNALGASASGVIAISSGSYMRIKDTAYTDAATFKTAMSGVYLVYELATETTETADAFTKLQICSPNGTEEYTDYSYSQGTRDVAIPVGHDTDYPTDLMQRIEDTAEIPNAPTTDGTYTLEATVSSGAVTYLWV